MKTLSWIFFAIITLSVGGYYGYTIVAAEDKSAVLIGDASHGHFQIELACSSCHTDAFGGGEVLQNACVGCHQDELDAGHDSHPKKKFTDPRNADRLAILDARYCVSCHVEHQEEQTNAMGVTLPDDYCFHCHQEIGDERESHKDLAFDSCATAGCHNYHDNRALYENFLVKHAEGPWLKDVYDLVDKTHAATTAPKTTNHDTHFAGKANNHPSIASELAHSAHGDAGLSCASCHSGADQAWIEKPNVNECRQCHETEATSFTEGKHGMRLAQGLTAMSPGLSEGAFQTASSEVHQGCNTCHSAHTTDTEFAETEACLTCHADEHSLAFNSSAHASAEGGDLVSCATCHMPRVEHERFGQVTTVVQHNQNDNLRPNEKMIRGVCMDCHSLAFAIDALADEELIKKNFNGQPKNHVPSIDWAKKREE